MRTTHLQVDPTAPTGHIANRGTYAGRRALIILVFFLCAVALQAAAKEAFLIHNRDRVVIYGDSITAGAEYQGYPRYLEAYLCTRFPAWKVSVWNRAQSGDVASNLARFKRDCLTLNPDVITFNMGMNDAAFSPSIAPGLRRFVDGITAMVALARQANPAVRIVLISPIFFEAKAQDARAFYSYVLRSYAEEEETLANRLGVGYIDLNLDYGQTIGLADAMFPESILFSGDGIHPTTAGGHLFIARHILKGLGAEHELALLHIDAKSRRIVSCRGAKAQLAPGDAGSVSVDRTLAALPFPVVNATSGVTYRDRAVAFLVAIADTLNRDTLQVTGLPAKAYTLAIDGTPVADLSTAELADGVNLSRFFNTPDQYQAVQVSEAVGRKQIAQAKLWQACLDAKTSPQVRTDLEAAFREATAAVYRINQPARHRFTLTPLDRELDRYQRYEQLLDISGPATLTPTPDGRFRQQLAIVVKNLSPLERRVEFLWEGAGVTPPTRVLTMAAGEKTTQAFDLDLPAGATPPRLSVRHQPSDLSFPALTQQYAPALRPRLLVPGIATAIAVDGVLNDDAWREAAAVDFASCMTPAMLRLRRGAGDFSTEAKLVRTAHNLAIGITVTDQDHVNHFTDSRFSWDDAVSVAIGQRTYTLALTSQGPRILPEDAPDKGIRFTVRREELRTVYELTIPWEQIGNKPLTPGAACPLDITVNDRDRDESHKDVNWTGSIVFQ